MAFTLDPKGGAEVLKVIVADEIRALGEQLAAEAGDLAVLEFVITDRAKARVKVPSDAQAKDGVLSKAAAAIGLEVRPSKKRPPRPPRVRKGNAEKARTSKQKAAKETTSTAQTSTKKRKPKKTTTNPA